MAIMTSITPPEVFSAQAGPLGAAMIFGGLLAGYMDASIRVAIDNKHAKKNWGRCGHIV